MSEGQIYFWEKNKTQLSILGRCGYPFSTSVRGAYIRGTQAELPLKEPQSVVKPLHTEVK